MAHSKLLVGGGEGWHIVSYWWGEGVSHSCITGGGEVAHSFLLVGGRGGT